MSKPTINNDDLKGKTRDDIIFILRTSGLTGKEATAYYNDNFKGERKDSFAAEFDDYAIESDDDEVSAFITNGLESGRINKSSGKSYYLNRAKLIARIKAIYA